MAAARTAIGRVVFFQRASAGDSLALRLAKHLESLGWRRDNRNLEPSRTLGASEGMYCRRHSSLLLAADTAAEGYVVLTRFTPLMTPCGLAQVDSSGRLTSFFPAITPPAGSNSASSESGGSGAMQAWHVSVTIEVPLEEVAAHYAAALEKHGIRLGPVVMRGDTLTRSARWERDETTWSGELGATTFGGERRVAVNLRRELDPDERY